MTFLSELRFAVRSLLRVKGMAVAVVLTLALGIGANAAIFSVVRGVLLRPLVNREEDRLIYIRQAAVGAENTTFSVPEIQDLRNRVTSIAAFGEFSTLGFTMVGLGEPRQVRAGVVDGNYFEVMGLKPVLGRLLQKSDDGPQAAGAAVLTYRFWVNGLDSDPTVIGKSVRLGTRTAVIVGVLEPSVPYPAETELIANVVTSPHHLSATMVTGREHRMTELFGRLAPGADLARARADLRMAHAGILAEHPEAYSPRAKYGISAVRLRDQITSRARTVLLVLLAASGLVFIVACSNVANLILARTVRRENELAVRAALGAGPRALRRTLLAESLVLCGTGAALGLLIAPPAVSVLSLYAARYSVRALDLTIDATLLWVPVVLALGAAVLLAYVPRLPSAGRSRASSGAVAGLRLTSGTNRRLRVFAATQIAASFVLLAGAAMIVRTLLTLQATEPGFETRQLLAIDVPVNSFGRTPEQIRGLYRSIREGVAAMPGVQQVAIGSVVPWRDANGTGRGLAFAVDGRARPDGEEDPRAKQRSISPGFFAALGVPVVAGRDFNDADRDGAERVVIVSQSLAQRMFDNGDAVNRQLRWTDSVGKFIGLSPESRRIVGVVADIDDENIEPAPMLTVYQPFEQEIGGGRVFVHARSDPYALVPAITRLIRDLASEQPVERATTLADVRAEVLAPTRVNAVMFGGFAAVALAISVVGVAGVLAFSVGGRTREFGIRLAVGSQPSHVLRGVMAEGVAMAAAGIVAGGAGGYVLARALASYVQNVELPGLVPLLVSASVLLAATVLASVLPAARAARIDVMKALRAD